MEPRGLTATCVITNNSSTVLFSLTRRGFFPDTGKDSFFLEVFIMSIIACDTPSQPIGNNCSALDEAAWRAICEAVAADAMKGCGLSHDYYVERFSFAIEGRVNQLPESQRAQALQIVQEWDYATPAQRQETQDWNAKHGYCSHGIELGYCPAGCDTDY